MSLLCCQVREGLIQRGVPLEKRLFCEKAGGVPDTSQGSIAGREKVCDLLCLQKPPGNAVCSLIWKGMTFLQNTWVTSLAMLHGFGSGCLCYFTAKCHRFLFHLNSTLTTTFCFADGSTTICMKSPLLWFQADSVSLWKVSSGVAPWPQLVLHWQELL